MTEPILDRVDCEPKDDEVDQIGDLVFPVCRVHDYPMDQDATACIPGIQEARQEGSA